MKTAFLYAGQGSQHPGMGKDLYDIFPEFRNAFDAAPLDFDLHRLCFEDPDQKLMQTEYTQPCMVAFASGVTAVLQKMGITADYAAGLSLGEYSALEAAGVFNAKTAIRTVSFRGKAMEKASRGIDCEMVAVLGLDEAALNRCCSEAASLSGKVVSICNYNCPGQLVISGSIEGIDKACELLKEKGAKRALKLPVGGAFHSPLMQPASEELQAAINSTAFSSPVCPVYQNVNAYPQTDPEQIKQNLIAQLTAPVRWTQTVKNMVTDGADLFVELGPGDVLKGLVKKISAGVEVA